MKKLVLNASLLLLASNLAAQLYVKPNPSNNTDSFIFANDVVLYVEEGIDLLVNTNNPDTRASIYLRGDSQLIQGDKATSQNTGNGHLSIWQRGWANAFDYNYWASPVGNPNDPASGNSRFGIPRIFDVRNDGSNNLHVTRSTQQATTTSLNGEHSIVPAGMDGTLRVSSRWIYTLRNSNDYASWVFIGNQNGLAGSGLAPGEGFTMKGTGLPGQVGDAHDQLYDFRGRPNDGDISITVEHNGTEGLSRLVGNPYPSALDMAAFLEENLDIEGQILYWDQNRTTNSHYIYDYQGGYGVWVPAGGTPIDGDGTSGTYTLPVFIMYDGYGTPVPTPSPANGAYLEKRFAPVGQGFVVIGAESISGITGSITFKNSMRRHVGLGQDNFSQFKPASLNKDNNKTTRLKSKIEGTLRFHIEIDDLYTRDMVLMFSDETTDGYDRGFDGMHPSLIQSGDVFWKVEQRSQPFVIQTRPYDFNSKVPIGLRVKNGQNNFKVNLVEMNGFNKTNNFNLYLYDELQNIYQKIDMGTNAVIHHTGGAGLIENRYYLVFKKGHRSKNGVNDGDRSEDRLASVNFFQNNKLSQLEVYNPETINIKSASVYEMSGKLVIHERNLGMQNSYRFSTKNLSSGVYLVKLVTAEDQIIDYKVTVHNK